MPNEPQDESLPLDPAAAHASADPAAQDTPHLPDAAAAAPEAVAEGAAAADGATEAAPDAAPDAASDAAPGTARPEIPELSPAQVATRLATLFPALFTPGQVKPLKLRIQADIQQRAPGNFTKKSLSIYLHRLTTSTPYLVAMSKSPSRFDLDGQPAGELAAEHRDAATQELARRRGLHEVRRAAENAARRQAEQQARAQHAAEHEARRDRAAMLRAFETSTLTRANFCALKRITDADLETVLVQARAERAERPPEPPRDAPRPHDDRGPRPDRADRGPRGERGDRNDGRPPRQGRPGGGPRGGRGGGGGGGGGGGKPRPPNAGPNAR